MNPNELATGQDIIRSLQSAQEQLGGVLRNLSEHPEWLTGAGCLRDEENDRLRTELEAAEHQVQDLRRENRIMHDALVEIMGVRFWDLSADYSPKAIARRALRNC